MSHTPHPVLQFAVAATIARWTRGHGPRTPAHPHHHAPTPTASRPAPEQPELPAIRPLPPHDRGAFLALLAFPRDPQTILPMLRPPPDARHRDRDVVRLAG